MRKPLMKTARVLLANPLQPMLTHVVTEADLDFAQTVRTWTYSRGPTA